MSSLFSWCLVAFEMGVGCGGMVTNGKNRWHSGGLLRFFLFKPTADNPLPATNNQQPKTYNPYFVPTICVGACSLFLRLTTVTTL